ncbi:MAG: hypothetical protein KM296_09355 [Brockia lithotrophica]|nr:hypothetical protein [Brockia lithotrophica]
MRRSIVRLIGVLEEILAVIIILAVTFEGIAMIGDLYRYVSNWELSTHYPQFLADVLFYIVGLEIAHLLISRSPVLMLNVLIFAIGRKVIIQSETVGEMLVGSLAIALLYVLYRMFTHGEASLPKTHLSFSWARGPAPPKEERSTESEKGAAEQTPTR